MEGEESNLPGAFGVVDCRHAHQFRCWAGRLPFLHSAEASTHVSKCIVIAISILTAKVRNMEESRPTHDATANRADIDSPTAKPKIQ